MMSDKGVEQAHVQDPGLGVETEGLKLDVRAGNMLQLAEQIFGVVAGEHPAIQGDGYLAGDDVGLFAAGDDGGVGGMAEQGLQLLACGSHAAQHTASERGVEQQFQEGAVGHRQAAAHGLDHHARDRMDVERQGRAVEFDQELRHARRRSVVVHQRTVSSGSARDGLDLAALLLGYLHHVELAAPVGLAEAAELADGVTDAVERFGMVLRQPGGAGVAAGLFVTDQPGSRRRGGSHPPGERG